MHKTPLRQQRGATIFEILVSVLILSFGPRDLCDELDDYVAALERVDREGAGRRAMALLEVDAAGRGSGVVSHHQPTAIRTKSRLGLSQRRVEHHRERLSACRTVGLPKAQLG